MKGFDDIQVEQNRRILLWAPSGAGKTTLLGQWPGLLMLDTDNEGLAVWKSKWYLEKYGRPDLVGWESFDDPKDEHGLFTDASAIWDLIAFVNKHADDENVKTIGMDSLSSVQDLCMHVGFEVSARDNKSKTFAKVKDMQTGKVRDGKLQHPVMVPTQADFGSEMSVFQQLMDGLMGIRGKDIICIAHERIDFADGGAIRGKAPLFTGQAIRARIAKWFSEVWYLDVNNRGERVLITQPTGLIQTVKTRSGLPAELVNPTYQSIMEAMR